MGGSEDVIRAAVESLKSEVEEMRGAMEALEKWTTLHSMSPAAHLDIRDEIEQVRNRPPAQRDITTDRLSRLDKLLLDCHPRALSFDEVGKLLEFGPNHKQIMTAFSKHLFPHENDRYVFGKAAGRGTGKTIRLTPAWKDHLLKLQIVWDQE